VNHHVHEVGVVEERVAPYPRRYGTSTRWPSAARGAATPSHARTSSGKPCNKMTGAVRLAP
jgi:hypothetical protein